MPVLLGIRLATRYVHNKEGLRGWKAHLHLADYLVYAVLQPPEIGDIHCGEDRDKKIERQHSSGGVGVSRAWK